MKDRWYRADFQARDYDFTPDPEYFVAESDEKAIAYAKECAEIGLYYTDIGSQVKFDLVQVTLVDNESECWEDIEVVWY